MAWFYSALWTCALRENGYKSTTWETIGGRRGEPDSALCGGNAVDITLERTVMFTLRCTKKLLSRGLDETEGVEERPTTLLGDWYANVIVRRPQHLVLCISERTLLPVLLPAKDPKSIPSRLPEAVCSVLSALSITPAAVETERKQMQALRVGRTASRRVLGSLNDFILQLDHGLKSRPERSLLEHSLWLAETPCGPIVYASPDRATKALFASAAILTRARQNAL